MVRYLFLFILAFTAGSIDLYGQQPSLPSDIFTLAEKDSLLEEVLVKRSEASSDYMIPPMLDENYRYTTFQVANGYFNAKYARYTTKKLLKRYSKRELKRQYRDEIGNTIRYFIKTDPQWAQLFSTENKNDRILHFWSEVFIESNGLIRVNERITVANYNYGGDNKNLIERGITREFPTLYVTKLGLKTTVPFKLISVKKNKEEEPWHSERLRNGYRYYFGRSDYLLPQGTYTYDIRYETSKQLKFFPDKTEFYWNVNGNGWNFTTDRVTCMIHFPENSDIIENDCYTGAYGDTTKNCCYKKIGNNTIQFVTTQKLNEYEGLSVAAAIKPGIIAAPDPLTLKKELAGDNLFLFSVIGLFLLFVILHFRHWYRVGRDPKPGVIIPQFEPPAGLSPADLGYLLDQDYSSRLFAATLVDMTVKRQLDIEVAEKGWLFKSLSYSFKKPASNKSEKTSASWYDTYGFDPGGLYGTTAERGTYNKKVANAYNDLEARLKARQEQGIGTFKKKQPYFNLNTGSIGIGIAFIVALLMAMLVYAGVYFMPQSYIVIFITIFVLSVIIQIIFMRIISAYSVEGRKMADQALGFRQYLSMAEEKMYDALTPPEKTLSLFEKFLPYAIALGVENEWSTKFKKELELAIENGYEPTYFMYHGSMSQNTSSHFFSSGDTFSGLGTTISSASTPPSSSSSGSSGSSGGGFSGGGGGGGGGGGW